MQQCGVNIRPITYSKPGGHHAGADTDLLLIIIAGPPAMRSWPYYVILTRSNGPTILYAAATFRRWTLPLATPFHLHPSSSQLPQLSEPVSFSWGLGTPRQMNCSLRSRSLLTSHGPPVESLKQTRDLLTLLPVLDILA